MLARQDLPVVRDRLVIAVVNFRQALGVGFDGLHCWVSKGY